MAGKPLQLFCLFLSTLSLRRATPHHAGRGCNAEISIHALLAESDRNDTSGPAGRCISIHALLAESDGYLNMDYIMGLNFYPRSPCGERQNEAAAFYNAYDFYPRSPCGERLAEYGITPYLQCISIHALLAESDNIFYQPKRALVTFLSTLSLRRATRQSKPVWHTIAISIHALLAESDLPDLRLYSATPGFLSTLSLRRATPAEELQQHQQRYFYPRSPCGERRLHFPPCCLVPYFYPRSPCGERPSQGV